MSENNISFNKQEWEKEQGRKDRNIIIISAIMVIAGLSMLAYIYINI